MNIVIKLYLHLRLYLCCLIITGPLLINNSFALEPAYWWHDTADTKFSNPDWMKGLPDELPLDKISMVGTHDSCGYKGGDAYASQRLSLTKQLTIGIRAMDIWTRHSKNSLYINHGIWYQGLTFDDVIKEVATFLYYHKTETVIMRISPDGTSPDDNKNTYEDAFKVVYNKYNSYFWKGPYNQIPKLKDIRGKIVILQKFPANTQYGIQWSTLKVQDHYGMKTNWDLYDRWEKVKKHINDSYDSGGGKGIYINYMTGSGGSFPYFVASGKSSPQTGAPWLMTGKTTPGWKNSYVDWPRINCFIGICSIPFVGINYSTSSYIKTKHSGKSTAGYVGILLADFPGQELIENVIAVNKPINPQYLCIPGYASCNGVCVDLKTSKSNCGQCGKTCLSGQNSSATCENGVCGIECASGFDDCDKIPTNGCEKSLTTITDCLSCGNKCPIPANGAPICTSSGCSIGECNKPYLKCGSDLTCTTNTDTSVDNCGACGKKCSNPSNGTATCSAGTCGFTCAQGFEKCGTSCVSQKTDINNCGGCGLKCPKPANGVAICENGVCGVSNCPSGLANCDKDLANGCETSILSDILSCGACGSACKIDNASSLLCINGSCGVSSCDKGWAQCGNQNGCLTNINKDFNNCGGCGKVCDLNNAKSSCTDGSCIVESCSTGFKDCNGTSGDGCEINSLTDVNNCGGCGNSCAKPANGQASCVAGVCGIKACEPGFADCDGKPENGCEVNINADENNCNGCGKICPALANGISQCENGTCGLKECIAGLGFMDCDKLPTNGCETPINTVKDCGGCGPQYTCTAPANASPLCLLGGACATGGSCNDGFKDCNNQPSDGCEVNLNNDPNNCGSCGTTCQPQPNGSPATCTNGTCESGICPAGLAHCPGDQGCQTPIDTLKNCGSCGNECSAPTNKTAICSSGSCGISPYCNEGYGDCDGDPLNGCETDLRSSTTNCGACGKTCNLTNSAGICANSQCVPGYGTCQAGFAHCVGPDESGCETELNTVDNCGGCGNKCSSQGGTPSCSKDGKCSIVCLDGFADCNKDPSDGCEVDLKTSTNNCNACGVACNDTNNSPTCNGGTCITGNCNGLFGKCGNDIGCATPLNTDENCGACGQKCNLNNVAVSKCSTDGTCTIVSCKLNFEDCNGDPKDGCEVDITKVENCGACGKQCQLLANTASPLCKKNDQGNYSCGIGTCLPGFAHYSSNENDGCETNTNTDVNHCGPNGTACPSIANGTPACNSGVCGIGSCNENYVDLNKNPSDGCEVNLKEDILNCGAIGNKCSAVNGTPNCVDGVCGIKCDVGFSDCNEQPGCETNILISPEHCGKCGTACSTANNSPSCIAGSCVAGTCSPGYGQCGSDQGCETKLNTDQNCGSCGHTCSLTNAASSCNADGKCIVSSCLPGWSDCNLDPKDGCETDITKIENCGTCGLACNTANNTPVCTTGECIIGQCLPGFGRCGNDSACNTPLNTDNNCGGCGKTCNLANVEVSKCSLGGECSIVKCKAGFMDCNGEAVDGCERDITTIDSCGACNNKCNLPLNSISTICNKDDQGIYSCGIGSCKTGFGNFDGDETNGCETNTNTDVNHCGPNGTACPSIANGTPACESGVCGVGSCNENYVDLNKNPSDGCEVNLKEDKNNCGTLGNVCEFANASAKCEDGKCVLDNCNNGFGLCGGTSCLPLNTVDNCGSCNNTCSYPNASSKCENGDCKLGVCLPGFALCGGSTCLDLSKDANNCAQCGNECKTPSNGSALCSAGLCDFTCAANFIKCGGGCISESSLASDVVNCGSCGRHCTEAPQNGSPSCQEGTCGFTCGQGYTQCGNTCVSQKDDINNCGGCGNVCSFANGSAQCVNGQCVLDQCNLGFGNCDQNQANGCEKEVNTTAQCGTCTNSCPEVNNRTPACLLSGTGGTCGSAICLPGFEDCDGNSENGCETNLNSSVNHCGACGTACTSANGQPVCDKGLCTTGTCNPGFSDCNKTPGDGCEINISSDINNCGGCGIKCSFENGIPRCDNGQCVLDSCLAGYGNCNGISSDGCELLVNSNSNCGSCGNICSAPANRDPICIQGLTCGTTACASGYGDCDGNASNGCEANFNTSITSCGSCGHTCTAPSNSDATCSAGTCGFTCKVGYTRCGNECISTSSLASDTNNCGGCGIKCTSAPANGVPACITSGCSFTCQSGYTKCGNGCIPNSDLLTDVNNCGSCGNVCTTPANGAANCQSGICGVAFCTSGFGNCDGLALNGCETNLLSTNINNCGACGTTCTTQPNGSPAACVSGTCAAGTCEVPYLKCGSDTGCNTNIFTSTSNCGACGTTCSSVNGTASCLVGNCGITCDASHADCTSSPGCETAINSTSNCGGCGLACNLANANPNCTLLTQGYVCGISSCTSGYANCDSNSANGCETPLSTNDNCGGCGIKCSPQGNTNYSCQPSGNTYTCQVNSCTSPFATCSGGTSCGTNLNTSATNCGGCGNNCTTLANSSGNTCSSGSCLIGSCSSGYANCDSVASNGCESSLSSILSCGACGNNCNNLQNTIGNSCLSNSCSIGSCTAGYGNCDELSANGCESALNSSLNCGGCGLSCNISGQNCNPTTSKCEGGVFSYYAYVLLDDNSIAQYGVDSGGRLSISTNHPTVGTMPSATYLNFSPDGTRIFVTSSVNKVSFFTEDKTIQSLYEDQAARLQISDPKGFVLSPDGKFAWIISYQSSEVTTTLVGTTGLTIANVSGNPYSTGGGKPVAGAVTPDGKYLFAINQVDQSIVQFLVNKNTGSLTANGTVSAIPSGGTSNSNPGPTMIRTSPDGRFVYVTNAKYNQVLQYSIGCDSLGVCGKLTLIGSVATGSNPSDLFVSPTGKFAYVVNKGANTVSQYSINSSGALTSLGTVATGTGPLFISVSYNGKYAYVSNNGTTKNISQYSIGTDGRLTPLSPATAPTPNTVGPTVILVH